MRVFISYPSNDTSLGAAHAEALERALASVRSAQPSHSLEDSEAVVLVLGTRGDPQVIQDYQHAQQSGKPHWVFVKTARAAQRNASLQNFLAHLNGRAEAFHHPPELAYKLQRALQSAIPVPDAWHAPLLPIPPASFVGREADLDAVAALLTDGQANVLVSGELGIGKTAFARHLAHYIRDDFPAGIFWVEHFGDAGQLLQTTFRQIAFAHPAARLAITAGQELSVEDLLGWLSSAPGRGLVIADDMHDLRYLSDLRAGLPDNFRLLVTTETPLKDLGWETYRLRPLNETESVGYLGKLLDQPANIAEDALIPLYGIASALAGHPLSLRLASGWMTRAGGWQSGLVYLQRLTDSPNPFYGRIHPQLVADELTEKALGLLYNNLTTRQKTMFRMAGAFAPDVSFSSDALMDLVDSGVSHDDIDVLAQGLIHHDESAGGYRIHRILHSYAEAMLVASEAESHARQGHLAYFEHAAADWSDADADSLPPDVGQLRHALEFALQHSPDRLVPFVLTAGKYLQNRHYDREVQLWLQRTLAQLPSGPLADIVPTQVRALGDLAHKAGDNTTAQEFYERALLIHYEEKSLSGQANTLKALGDLHAERGELDEAQDYYDRTLLLYAQIDFQLGRANTLKSLGDLSLQSGDIASARGYFDRTLDLYEQIDFQLGQAHTLKALGDLNQTEKDYLTARKNYDAALELYQEINFHSQQAATLMQIGALEMMNFRTEPALEAYRAALRFYRQIANAGGQADALVAIGEVAEYNHDYNTAREVYQNAYNLLREEKLSARAAHLKLTLSSIEMALRQPGAALDAALSALRTFYQLEDSEALEDTRRHLRELARNIGSEFEQMWAGHTKGQPLPDWLKLAPATNLPQTLVYAVRDFMLADDLNASHRIATEFADILLTDEADEVFARMLRQYAGQANPTRQIDKYRSLLQRCRQIGIDAAFAELSTEPQSEIDTKTTRLRQQLDAFDEALIRLRDIPLVYASIQVNRATTLRELAEMPGQDRLYCFEEALKAYDDALTNQEGAPVDYAQTQILRADTLHELAQLPDADIARYLQETLNAYDAALRFQSDMPYDYARTQLRRANTLYQLAEQPAQDMADCMRRALEAYNEALNYLKDFDTLEYARTQSHRALVLHEMAGLPDEDFRERMGEALTAYDEALEFLRDVDDLEYARTGSRRVALLRDMAGLPGEERTARLYQALAASNEALRYLQDSPQDYAQTQIHRAHLQREIAGLTGEHRLARMREALATYNDAMQYLAENPIEYATVQNSRASLLRELAGISGENPERRLEEGLDAASEALMILERLAPESSQYRSAQRMIMNVKKSAIKHLGDDAFVELWDRIVGTPLPLWVEG